jgi:hypothetical protein|tara:strand:+ start:558 stop:1277 length:720 start_codon:yes stop_codon:yes gene_type:complete
MNNNLVLLCGKSATGKSASLDKLDNPEGVMYLNCENNKKLPFKSKFKEYTITDPTDVPDAIAAAEKDAKIHTIVIDSLTYLMDMYESTKVLTSTNTMKAWGSYAQFLKNMMSQNVGNSTKNIIFIAHTSDIFNESEMVNETMVKVKGSLMNTGIESYFSTVIGCKKVPIQKLSGYKSDMLTYNDEEKLLEYKYVYQTKLTKDTVNERIRSPMRMWDIPETYIDNNLQQILNRLHEYYDE